jgi:hypothetical protein
MMAEPYIITPYEVPITCLRDTKPGANNTNHDPRPRHDPALVCCCLLTCHSP